MGSSTETSTQSLIPFSRPFPAPLELENLRSVLESGHIHGDGPYTASATAKLRQISGCEQILLTTSGTHALDMASILLDIGPGDEVILPDFTFSSGATSIALRGAQVVFADIDTRTGNVDPHEVEKLVTSRTKAISVMHYGGVSVDMSAIARVADDHGLPVIEDNAHGLGAKAHGRSLGSFGVLAAQSFHDTKNVHAGEGGALLINDPSLRERAEVLREKGTDRSKFLRGQVDKYTWVDHGSSFLPSELNAAVLDAQLASFEHIQALRHRVWDAYREALQEWADDNDVTLMAVPEGIQQPAHVFWMLMPSHEDQTELLRMLRDKGIVATFHYQPLHASPAGERFGSAPRGCPRSADFASRLVRLPLWAGMSEVDIQRVVDATVNFRPTGDRARR